MEWDQKAIENLSSLFQQKYAEMKGAKKTDRRNFSAVWNKYLQGYGATVVFNFSNKDGKCHAIYTLQRILNLINRDNSKVSDALVISNPDRAGQFILVPREMASRIIVLGML